MWAWYCLIVSLTDACTPIGSKNKPIYICVSAVHFQIRDPFIFFSILFLKIKGDKNSREVKNDAENTDVKNKEEKKELSPVQRGRGEEA